MKLTLHPGSAVVGAVLFAAPFVLMSFQSQVAWPRQVPIPVSVQEMLDPRDAVIIDKNTPYVVPSGKLLVVSAIVGANSTTAYTEIYIDGVQVYDWYLTRVFEIPDLLTVREGSTIEARGSNDPQVWGYLTDD